MRVLSISYGEISNASGTGIGCISSPSELLRESNSESLTLAGLSNLKPIIAEVVFVGGHIYKSRIVRDAYTIEDVIDQISSAMDEAAEVLDAIYMTILQNPNGRADRYGNFVRDRAILECSTRHPRAELFSIVPKGDKIKPTK